MEKTAECLETLAEECRRFWEKDGNEDSLEVELVRAEDHLEELTRMTWDYEVFIIASKPSASKIVDDKLYGDQEEALRECRVLNLEVGGDYKVYRAIINIEKEELKDADLRV